MRIDFLTLSNADGFEMRPGSFVDGEFVDPVEKLG